jgi:hypothetical protein
MFIFDNPFAGAAKSRAWPYGAGDAPKPQLFIFASESSKGATRARRKNRLRKGKEIIVSITHPPCINRRISVTSSFSFRPFSAYIEAFLYG